MTLSACAFNPSVIEPTGSTTFTILIDTAMFSQKEPLQFILWNAGQLDITNNTADCVVSYDAESKQEEIHCPKGVTYEPVNPEEFIFQIQQINGSVTFETDHISVGEKYRLLIIGLSSDNCNTTSASIEGTTRKANVVIENIQWATTLMACL